MQMCFYFLCCHPSHPGYNCVQPRTESSDQLTTRVWFRDKWEGRPGDAGERQAGAISGSQPKENTSQQHDPWPQSTHKESYFCLPSTVPESSTDYQITRAFGRSQHQQLGSHKVTAINTNRTNLSVTGPQDRPCYTCLSWKCTPDPPRHGNH